MLYKFKKMCYLLVTVTVFLKSYTPDHATC